MDKRKLALQEFLNDTVTRLELGLYTWRGKYYEVLPYKELLKRGGWSGFIKWTYKNVLFGIRELSDATRKKHFPFSNIVN